MCDLLDDRNGSGGQGGLEPAASGGLVFPEGTAGAYAFPAGSCAAGMPLQPVGLARSDPVGLLLPEAAATLLDRQGPERPQQQDHDLA